MAKIGKKITDPKVVEYFLGLQEEDITTTFIMENFAMLDGKPPKYDVFDIIHIPVGAYKNDEYQNTEAFDTTLGSWVFNVFLVRKDFMHIFGYIDNSISGKQFDKINKKLSYALLEDDITMDQFKLFLEKTQKLQPYITVLSPSVTNKLFTCDKVVEKEKKRLLKKYEKEIAAGDEIASEKIEKELLDFIEKYLEDDESMECYDSGARMKKGNHLKNMHLMRGASKDPDPHKGYNIMTSNYMGGFSKEEYAILSNSLSAGPYARGKKTAKGGYWEKLFVSAFQHLKLDPPGSDCGTKRYKELVLNDPESYMYSYIIEGNNLVELTSKNMEKYRGKKVKIRFAALCESKTGFCNKCAGNLPYRTGIINIGMALAAIPAKLKLVAMKAFHDSNVKTVEIDINKAFGD